MKKTFLFSIALALMFCFSGCVPSSQLNETAVVQAIGIDLQDTGEFEVTLQIYSPKGAGAGSAIDTSKNNADIVSATGVTLASAIRSATQLQGKEIFTGHNRILVIGREFAENGIEGMFSYFDRSALTRQNVQVMLADKSAKEIISANIDQGVLAAEAIENMVDNHKNNGLVYSCPYYQLAKNTNVYNGSAVMPLIRLQQNKNDLAQSNESEESNQKEDTIPVLSRLKLDESAVFSDYQLSDVLTQQETRGILLLQDMLKQTVLTARSNNEREAAINLYECHTTLSLKSISDRPQFVLKVKAKGSLDEVLIPAMEIMNKSELRSLEQACGEELKQESLSAFETLIRENKSDVLHLEDFYAQKTRQISLSEKDREELFQNAELTVEMDFKIDRVGMESDEEL